MHKKAEGSTTGWENVYEYEETALLETAEESFGLLSVREVCSRDFFFMQRMEMLLWPDPRDG